jgi:Glycosyltransferase family 87
VTFQQRFRTTAGQVWINVGVILCLILWLHGGVFIPSEDATRDKVNRPRADFMMFYGSARLLETSPHELYDIGPQGEAQRASTGLDISANDLDFLPYPYPAVVALAMVPLTFWEYKTAYAMMVVINFLLLGMTIWLLSDRLNLDRTSNELLVLCTTASMSVYATLLQGQVSFFALLLVVLVVTNLKAGRDARAGTWAGFLAFKPTLLPVWLFWFTIRRRWAALRSAVAVCGAMALISILVVGLDGTRAYASLSRGMMRGDFHTVLPNDMPTLRAVTYFLGFPDSVWLGTVAVLLFVISKTMTSADWEYCVVIVASILGAPHLHPQDLVLLLAVVALLAANLEVISRRTTWAFVGIILWQAVARGLFAGENGNHWPVLPISLVAVLAYLLYRARNAMTKVPATT